ncbi:sulfatase-like hydrolase/transferase [Lysobacter sp. LF1]|uniref:Sulfatase-like hydrolase/transferase n=1 Tax=Lysobacter stagni TaxID=3045172 RepID=A0ABT6XJX6_9GAMM|nr:sulfatase-like hydrolase/transferase [Lysobacter sp. LF1]MDI9240368.1 sulfatase-like hydrolase/transferase [Lysobacter sp. LF1]
MVKAPTVWIVVKLVLLALYLLGTNRMLAERVAHIGLQPGLAVFAAVWLLCVLSMLVLAFHARPFARVVWSAIFFLGNTFTLSHALITSSYLGLTEFEQLLGLIGFVGNLAGFHDAELIEAAAWSLLGVVAMNLPPWLRAPASPTWRHWLLRHAGLAPLLPVAVIAGILYLRGGEGSNGFPGQFNTAAFATVLGLEKVLAPARPEREDVALAHPGRRPLRHIVMVMDESVRGDYVDLNVDDGVETGLQPLGSALFNFGVAASSANCSSTSNASLRYGVTRDSYLRDLQVNPSFWRYAAQAGYRTIYLDAQRQGGKLQNFMDEHELAEIDEFVQVGDGFAPEHRDVEAGRLLKRMLARERPSFIFVNKMGCHFPYEGKYPAEATLYAPTMERTYFSNEVDPDNAGFRQAENAEQRWRQVNSYRNCLAWNTRSFFREAMAGASLDDALIVYTADHGQNFHEDGSPGAQTHCTIGPASAGEGRVPLAAMTRNPHMASRLREAARRNQDRASHFNVYPTLLDAMGYRLPAQDAGFEPTLYATLPESPPRFLSTYFVRFGREPVWNSIGKPAQLRDGLPQALASGDEPRARDAVDATAASGSP